MRRSATVTGRPGCTLASPATSEALTCEGSVAARRSGAKKSATEKSGNADSRRRNDGMEAEKWKLGSEAQAGRIVPDLGVATQKW